MLLVAPLEMSARKLYVGPQDSYKNIKHALSQAQSHDTIIVRNGVYVENITIRLPVFLKAENMHQAVIGDGSGVKANITIRQDEVNGAIIEGFRFAPGNWHGIRVGEMDGGNYVLDCEIRNCLIEGRMKGILVANQVNGIRIINNVIRDCSQEGIAYNGFGPSVISGNTVEDCEGNGIGISDRYGDPLIINDNAIIGNQMAGIRLERPGVVMERNRIEGNGGGLATNTACDGLILRDSNQIVNNLGDGVQIESRIKVIIRESVISGNEGNGIVCRGDLVLMNSEIRLNGDPGVRCHGGTAHLEGNTIEQNEGNGAEMDKGTFPVRVINNRICENKGHGLFPSDSAIVVGNEIMRNEECGIKVVGGIDEIPITGNRIGGNKGSQISVDYDARTMILKNIIFGDSISLISNVGPGGINLHGSALIEGNSIQHIHGAAINIEESSGKIEIRNGNIIGNSYQGIMARAPATITGNLISDCERQGIGVTENASGTVLGWNKIKGCEEAVYCGPGVQDVEITWNNITENGVGLYLDGQSVLRSNTVSGNRGVGLKIFHPGTDLGQLNPLDSGKNAFFGNGRYTIRNFGPDSLWAPYNYWDTGNIDSIDAAIFDDDEDAGVGPVVFEPFLGDFNVGLKKNESRFSPGGIVLTARPNPFRLEVALDISLNEEQKLEIRIADMQGRIVHSSGSLQISAGEIFTYRWDRKSSSGDRLPAGMYRAMLMRDGIAQESLSLICLE